MISKIESRILGTTFSRSYLVHAQAVYYSTYGSRFKLMIELICTYYDLFSNPGSTCRFAPLYAPYKHWYNSELYEREHGEIAL